MIILGLTGSIGMGKSTAAEYFRILGVPIHDADATVHRLMGKGGAALSAIEAAFPGTVSAGSVDRGRLGGIVFGDAAALRKLEGILHPLVAESRNRFLAVAQRTGQRVVVLDVPLLFETGGDALCDAVVLVSAPAFIQRQRVLQRPGMTVEKLDAILAQQMPDREKRRRADFIVPTGLGRVENFRAVRTILGEVRQWRGRHWPPSPARIDFPRNPSPWAR